MVKSSGYILLFLVVMTLCACHENERYTPQLKTLDSLNVALNQKVMALQKTDTLLLQRCITRFTYYNQFIKQNVNDTLTKVEADNLQLFYTSGNNLQNYWSNRFALLGRALLINSQQNKLGTDIRNKTILPEDVTNYLTREKEATAELLEAAEVQQRIYYSGMEEFKISLKGVEELIRKRNRGELPLIIKDTVAL